MTRCFIFALTKGHTMVVMVRSQRGDWNMSAVDSRPGYAFCKWAHGRSGRERGGEGWREVENTQTHRHTNTLTHMHTQTHTQTHTDTHTHLEEG